MDAEKLLEKTPNQSPKTFSPIHTQANYFPALDGWRGIAILFVLLAHWFPLGPASLKLNSWSGVLGISIFFALSGFLITNLLIKNDSVRNFLIRRIFRILPLAYLYLAIVLPLMAAPGGVYLPNLLFYANWPPFFLDYRNSHFWSLSVEVEFYLAIALIVFFFKKRGLLLIPLLGILVTGLRVLHGKEISIETYYRVDEILSGACLALVYSSQNNRLGTYLQNVLKKANPYMLIVLLIVSAHEWSGFFNYARPYFAALLVGTTLYQHHTKIFSILTHPVLKYIATISFALYVIHPIVAYGWLDPNNTDSKIFKYFVQRPISIIILFTLAHFSTFYYEKYWISLGKKLSNSKKLALTRDR
jgi:peptidoglycan/LPS O-acetylase OafA/YrhL